MKKRIFDRILTVVGTIVALAFVAVLLTTIFGGIEYEEFDNSLVKWLFVAMAIIYLVIATLTLINLFSDGDIVKEIALNRDRTGSTKATASVIKNLTRKYIKTVEGVKCTKVTLILTEYGVNLRINVKIKDLEIKETTTYIKKLLDNVFDTTLDYKFHSIDFKVQALKSNYEPPVEKLRTETDKEVLEQKTIKMQKEAQELKEEELAEKIKEATETVNDIDIGSEDEKEVVITEAIETEEVVHEFPKDIVANHDDDEIDNDHFSAT